MSIRWKTLLAISTVLLAAMGTYLYLATELFTRDKLTYVYDLNATLVDTVAEEVRLDLSLLEDKLNLLDAQAFAAAPAQREAVADAWLARDRSVVRVEIWELTPKGAERVLARTSAAQLDEISLTAADLDGLRKARPLPLVAVAAGGMQVQNSSLPPDAALLTAAAPLARARGGALHVGVVDLRPDRVLRILGRSALYTTYLVDNTGEVLAHPDPARMIERTRLADREIVRAALAGKVARGVREFAAPGGEQIIGSFALIPVTGAAVIAEIPRAEALRASRELVYRSLLFGVAIVIAAFVASVFFSRALTQPLLRLRAATKVVGAGDFRAPIEVTSQDEIGELAESFRAMVRAIEEKQEQLLQAEKMAAFGQLGAGITHEVKNPLTSIIGFAQLAKARVDEPQRVREYLAYIENESVRCKAIVERFLRFARADKSGLQEQDLNAVLDDGLKIVSHQLSLQNVTLETNFAAELPRVVANPQQIQQVLLNLVINAQQVMPDGGKVEVRTWTDSTGGVLFSVKDTGPGVPADLRKRIFEPFFTTKPPGQGTGLGLSVTYGIVRDHGGTIWVEGEKGEGATFVVWLPAPAAPVSASAAAS